MFVCAYVCVCEFILRVCLIWFALVWSAVDKAALPLSPSPLTSPQLRVVQFVHSVVSFAPRRLCVSEKR